MDETIHLVIKGKVQGVYYRASAREAANKSGIKGWVKNMPDGNVEVLASGSKEQLEKFVEWCRRGPKHAVVHEVIIKTDVKEENLSGFFIIK